MIKNNKAFTLVELVIVIIIVAILSIVGVTIYRGYVTRAMMSEAKALMGAVERGEVIYYTAENHYLAIPETSYNEGLDIDVSGNKYFTSFEVTVSSSGEDETAMAITRGAGEAGDLSLTLDFYQPGEKPRWIENVQ